MNIEISNIKFDERSLVPAIVQDVDTMQLLMLAYMNAESLDRTLHTNQSWFWSRSRARLWHKGEASGNTQRVVDISVDCDRDAIRLLVEPNGPACHTGAQSCFHNALEGGVKIEPTAKAKDLGQLLGELYSVVESRKRERPEGSYSSYLFNEGLDKILKKVGEEAAETIIAAKNDDASACVREASDLLYHLIVLMVEKGITLDELARELGARR